MVAGRLSKTEISAAMIERYTIKAALAIPQREILKKLENISDHAENKNL
jgi:hypothetical protein